MDVEVVGGGDLGSGTGLSGGAQGGALEAIVCKRYDGTGEAIGCRCEPKRLERIEGCGVASYASAMALVFSR